MSLYNTSLKGKAEWRVRITGGLKLEKEELMNTPSPPVQLK